MKRTTAVVLLMIGAHLCAAGAVHAQSPAETPVPRGSVQFRGETWLDRFYDNGSRLEAGDVDVLFIGDSITHAWEGTGLATWERYYGHRKAVNMGFSGDRTQHVLWRLLNGGLGRVSPEVAVIMIGTNNSGTDSSRETALGVRAICNTLRALLPETKILLLGIFPRGATADNWLRITNEATNAMIAQLDDGEWVHYLDIGADFLDTDGALSEEIMPDRLHPNERGYEIWAQAMEPTLARLLGDTPVR